MSAPSIRIESLTPELADLAARWAGPADLARMKEAAAAEPLGTRVVVEDGAPVAVALGATTRRGYRFLAVRWSADRGPRDLPALVEDARRRFPWGRLEATTRRTAPEVERPGPDAGPDDPHERAVEQALEAAGFVVAADQVHVARSLDGFAPADADPFTYRPVREVGRAAMLALLAEIIPPAEQARRHESIAERFESFIGAAHRSDGIDASLWHVAELDGAPAGIVLGQRFPELGTLLYCGLRPALRGRGLGAALHHHALARLRRAGATAYRDSTTRENAAMQRVFARHGCKVIGGSRLWVLPRPAPPPVLEDFAALVEALRATDHQPSILDPSGWLQTRARAGEHEATLDVVWLRDHGVVQVVCVLPTEVPPDAVERCAMATNTANAALDVSGFALDAASRTIRYQLPIWLDERGQLSTHAVRGALATAVRTTARFLPWWEQIARGGLSADSISWARHWID